MLKLHQATKAIIMAAGTGDRLKPVTNTVPKPLIEVNGKRMIETLLDALIENGINDIYIVVGHLKEQFNYLKEKYRVNIMLITNSKYNVCNNISSLYVAREYLGNCIITDGDLIIHNPNILNPYFEASGYCSAWTDKTDEWLQTVDENGNVLSCSRTGGHNGWQLFSISFWSEEDGEQLRNHLEEAFESNPHIYWDDIPMFHYKEHYNLKIRQINHSDLVEIDSVEELNRLYNAAK